MPALSVVLRFSKLSHALLALGMLPLVGCGGQETRRSGVEISRTAPQVRRSGGMSREEVQRRARIAAQVTGRTDIGQTNPREVVQPRKTVEPRGRRPKSADPVDVTELESPKKTETGAKKAETRPSKTETPKTSDPAEVVKADPETAGDSKKKSDELSKADIEERIRSLLERLQGGEREANRAYREIWKLDARLVPRLLDEVAATKKTELRHLDILVLQNDFARLDEPNQRWYYIIKGLGRFELDDIAMNKVYNNRGRDEAKVRLKSFDGFPLGLVVRAGLLNRFYSVHFPRYDENKNLVRWWKDYYRRSVEAEKRRVLRAG